MTTNEIIIAIVTAVLVVFSLTVALVIPKRSPGFPGRHLGVFLAITAVLAGGMIATIEVLGTEEEAAAEVAPAAEGGGEPAAPAETPTEATPPAETAEAAPPVETVEPAPAVEGDPAAGKEIFASAGCVACHTLADAGATGAVGPNLDEAKPPYDLVIDRVTNGQGAMPPFAGTLDETQIQDVAAYVVQATSG